MSAPRCWITRSHRVRRREFPPRAFALYITSVESIRQFYSTRPADIEAIIAALGGRFDADEVEVIKRVLREYGGAVPDAQLIEEAGLALAVWRRGNSAAP